MIKFTIMYLYGLELVKEERSLPFVPQRGNTVRLHGKFFKIENVDIDFDNGQKISVLLDNL